MTVLYKYLFCYFVFVFYNVAFAEDFYETLGITKDASLKEIRKAFKKLALIHHPDKNVNDPDAHDKFVRINHIYEVLKDEDMRKKYDKYGEEGLKEDHPGGGRYESYSYYRDEFGIYDDDPEVVTLDGGDFDAAVNSGEVWFVNFYSPRCSHCHELAPTWRKFAEEFSGALNIGAVNCRDNRWVCNQNGVHSFPSLFLFLKGGKWRDFASDMSGVINVAAVECSGRNRFLCMRLRIKFYPNLRMFNGSGEPIRYQGDRSKKDLIRFVMNHVNIEVIDLWDGNIKEETQNRDELPWVVSFCGGGKDEELEGDCPSRTTKRKLAGLMNGLAHVGSVECDTSPDVCENALVTETLGVYYFPAGTFPNGNDKMHHFKSLDAKEIHAEFMQQLVPGLPRFSKEKLEKLASSKKILAFLEFSPDQVVDSEESSLKKLPSLLKEHKIVVARVHCHGNTWCQDKLRLKEDVAVMFKGKGIADFEVFHGRLNTAEVKSFAQDSAQGKVSTLNPNHFKDGFMADQSKIWFVDFFAPWCPPCRALLPELRRASLNLREIKFGTIDCVLFPRICQEFDIHSYPSTFLFNGTTMTEYTGHHSSSGIARFIQDLINPPYEHLTPDTFLSMVQKREPGVTWIVDFYANWCGPCMQLLPAWRKMSKLLVGIVKVGAIDCAKNDEYRQFCKRHTINAYPEIRLFPAKKRVNSNPLYKVYKNWNRQAFAMASWALEECPHGVEDMKISDFEDSLPADPSAWVLDFYAPWCGHCKMFAPKFILSSLKFKGDVKFGKINCDMLPSICSRNGVNAYPTVLFFPPQSDDGTRPRKKAINSQDPDAIVKTLENFMKPYEDIAKKKQISSSKDEL